MTTDPNHIPTDTAEIPEPRDPWIDTAMLSDLVGVAEAVNQLAEIVMALELGDVELKVEELAARDLELQRRVDVARHNADTAITAYGHTADLLAQLSERMTRLEDRVSEQRNGTRYSAAQLAGMIQSGRANVVRVHEAIKGPDDTLDVRLTLVIAG